MPYLEKILLRLPKLDGAFAEQLTRLLSPFGTLTADGLEFKTSQPHYYPTAGIYFEDVEKARASFILSDQKQLEVSLANTTGQERLSSFPAQPLSLKEVTRRLINRPLRGLDHLGFNLPWFEGGIHPEIKKLRTELQESCLYYQYPTGEPWDFILPGTNEEIASLEEPDYSVIRRPKFELVTSTHSSRPLIQLEVLVQGRYEDLAPLFPEAMDVPELRDVWINTVSPYDLDLYLVLNGYHEGDWSAFFKGNRLTK